MFSPPIPESFFPYMPPIRTPVQSSSKPWQSWYSDADPPSHVPTQSLSWELAFLYCHPFGVSPQPYHLGSHAMCTNGAHLVTPQAYDCIV